MGRSSTVIGKCEACQTAIFEDHPYAWCDRCGAPLPEKVKAALPELRRPPQPEPEGVPLVVDGRDVPCPICQHTRYRIREALMGSRTAAFFNVAWASAAATTYTCMRCSHVLWFKPP